MKKFLFALALLFGMSLTSCGGSSESNTDATDCTCDSVCACDSVCTCDSEPVDTISVDTVEVEDSVL